MTDDSRVTTDPETDARFMRRALSLAERGWGRTAPNPMVGAVVVRDGVVVGEGHHTRFGAPHAEVEALARAGDRARGATMYVTLEPCTHHGKTPPCVDALVRAGIARVVVASRDPNPVAAGGLARLRDAGVEVAVGVEEDAAVELNASFFHALHASRPWVTLKLAVSIDGAIADHTRRPAWLTGPESRAEVHRLRAGADAVAVGVGTVIADDPALTVREVSAEAAPRRPPTRVVFDRALRTPVGALLVRTAREIPTVIVTAPGDSPRAAPLREAGVSLVEAEDARAGLEALRAGGIRSLLVEGGAGIATALLGASLVDRLIIFQAPLVLGAGALNAFASLPGRTVDQAHRWPVVRRATFGTDLMTVYALTAPAPDRAAEAVAARGEPAA